jgi:monoamine oxidase
MRGSEAIWRALEEARRLNLTAAGEAPPLAGGGGLTRRALLLALGATGAGALLPRPLRAAPIAPGPVAIIGGGIAGLSALWHLTQAGIDAHLYEARARLGGRMYTAHAKGVPAIEIGGQLVNTDHDDMHVLAREFGVALIDRKGAAHRTMVLAGGKEIPEARLAAALRGIAGQIDADSVRLDQDYARVSAELDQLSFTSYLDRHAALMPAPWVRGLMEMTARTEYGCEPGEASAIELIFNLPTIAGRRIDVLSRSDERYLLAGGSSALVDAMTSRLANRLTTNKHVTRVDPLGAGARLFFADGSSAQASAVIVATPASITRKIDFRIPLPPLWRRFIAEVGLGRNGKVQAVMATRPWEKPVGRGGEIWQTANKAGVALGWDGGVRPATGPGSVWTWFLGGDEVAAADLADPHALAKRFAGQAEKGVPGMTAATTALARRTNWHRDPLAMGAYVNFRPGQLTRFGRLIWKETDGAASAPPSAAPVYFAGEHLSDAYPGYMNGGAQTGRLAARAIIASRAHARRLS